MVGNQKVNGCIGEPIRCGDELGSLYNAGMSLEAYKMRG